MRRAAIALAVVAVALGAAPGALAADHIWLDARASLSEGWNVRISGDADGVNVTLHLRRRGAQEFHGYGPPQDELSFDGTAGRLRFQDADLRVEATGLPVPDLMLACAGMPMQKVPVKLSGTLLLRTGLRGLDTVRVTSLAGTVEYNEGPSGTCYPSSAAPPPICRNGRTLATAPESSPFVDVSWDSRPLYRYARITYKRGAWSHSLEIPLTRNPFSGFRASLPRRGALRGTLWFHLRRRGTPSEDPGCGTTAISTGTVSGKIVAAFRAWGTRTDVFATALGGVVDDRF